MKRDQLRKCLYLSVMRGAICNTDHQLLRAKMMVGKKKCFRKACPGPIWKKWNVSHLNGSNVDDQGNLTTMGKYLMGVDEPLKAKWQENDNVQEKWNILKCALCERAEAELGFVKNKKN